MILSKGERSTMGESTFPTDCWGTAKQRIVVIGNGGGGKTTLSRAIAEATELPLHEVDRIQYRAGWEVAPAAEVTSEIEQIIATDRWIIDGFGPWPTFESRCERADTVIFVDFPLWIHFWWAAERQVSAARGEARLGGPEGCPLDGMTEKVFRAIGFVHEEIRPKILELLPRVRDRVDLIEIHSPEELDALHAAISL